MTAVPPYRIWCDRCGSLGPRLERLAQPTGTAVYRIPKDWKRTEAGDDLCPQCQKDDNNV